MQKRPVIILRPDHDDVWIHASPDAAPTFMNLYPADELTATLTPKALVKASSKTDSPPSLFD